MLGTIIFAVLWFLVGSLVTILFCCWLAAYGYKATLDLYKDDEQMANREWAENVKKAGEFMLKIFPKK